MSKKQDKPNSVKKSSVHKWADELTISANSKQGGIELRFNAEPSPELQPKLRAMGFRHSKSQVMWYGENTSQAIEFAKQVEAIISTSQEGPDLILSPTFDAVKTNIEKKEFSYVMITLRDGQVKNYVVFEPSKPKAEVIANSFARKEFGDQFLALAAKPRLHVKEARILFDEGKIIFPEGQNVPHYKKSSIKGLVKTETVIQEERISDKAEGKTPLREILLTTKDDNLRPLYKEGKAYSAWSGADLFVKGLIGKFSDVYYKIIWNDDETIEGSVDLEPADFYTRKENILSGHVNTYFTNLSKTQPNEIYSRKAIEKARRILEHYQLEETNAITSSNNDTPADTQRETERLALDKFYKWATQQEDLSNKPDSITKEDFEKWFKDNYPELTEKNIESIWESHNRILKSFKRFNKRSTGKALMQPYSSIYKKLMQVIPDLLKHIQDGKHHGKSEKDPKGGLMNLNYDYIGQDKKGNYIIALSHYFEQNGDMVADPDMQIRILPELEAAEAMTFQDQFKYQEVYPDKGDGKEYVYPKLKKDLNQFLNQWLTNILHQGHKIDLSKEKSESDESEVNYFREAYKKLGQLIPDLLTTLNKEKYEGKLTIQKGDKKRIITYVVSLRDDASYSVWLNEFVDDENQLESDIVFEPKKKQARVTAEWLSFYYVDKYDRNETEDEIDDRDGDISEEMTRGLTEWLDDILPLGHQIHLSEVASIVNYGFERLHTPEEEAKIIEQFLAQGFKRSFSAQEAFDKKLPVIDLAFRYVDAMEYFRDHIENPRKEKIKKLRKDLKDLQGKVTHVKRNALKDEIEQLEAEMNFAEKLIQDESLIFQDDLFAIILAKEKGHANTIEEDISGFRDYVVTNVLDNRAIESYHSQPVNEVVNELIDEYFNKEEKSTDMKSVPTLNSKAITEDLKHGDTFVPNVLVPASTKEPFYSQIFQIYDMKEVLKNNFPHLLKITNETLGKASPTEMFELIQFGHPSEHGIDVDRISLLNEWEKRGRNIFKALGFPTDDIYPYVNLYLGYESVEPLKEMLFDNNKEGDEWWAIAEHSRPVADIKKGLKIIKDRIEKEKREMKTYLNPKTGKPKLEYKQQVKDVEHTITNLEESKEVLQHYLDNPPKAGTEKEEVIVTDPLANENGVYTAKTASKNFEEIEIPMPKGAQFEASVSIVKTSNGNYVVGLHAAKKFGDHEGLAFPASVEGQSYSTREEALKYGLKFLELRLEVLETAKDSILGNEEKKKKQLNMALDALKEFAEENNITLENKSATAKKDKVTIIKGLENTYWTKEDNKHPVNKAIINGMEFDQARLREAISSKLEKLPIDTLQQIVKELSLKFKERRPLATYERSLVTIGKTGDKRKATLIASYVDDMIIDNDDKANNPVMTLLVDLLFSSEHKLVDLPQNIEKPTTSKVKKQSQYDLNKEIENFIDKKDKEESPFNEEEKNYIRQFTGSGGLIKEGAAGRGVLYEYYTPEIVVQKMWDMAKHFGYDGGSILEPSVGTGNFLKYAPKDATIFGYETNHYSARIAQILYPHAHIYEKAFETLFFAGNVHLKDKFQNPGHSLAIGNPPYGEFTGRYAGMGEKQYTGATEYDQYFILRGLDLLKKGGLLIYLIPSSFVTNQAKFNKAKEKIAAKADLVDLYRLPSRIFDTTDIGTDVLVLRKNK
jgi:uncharacterized protein YqiB (DUF1249 family)